MKNRIVCILCALALLCTACGAAPSQSGGSPQEAPASLAAMSAQELQDAVSPCLEAYNSVLRDTFGVETDGASSAVLYEDESAAQKGEPKAMIPAGEVAYENGYQASGEYKGLLIDPAMADYYLVKGFSTLEELRASLRQWMEDEVFEETLQNNFAEYDGALYLVRGGRGYGTQSIALDTAAALGDSRLTVDGLLFEEKTADVTLTLENKDGAWRILSASWAELPPEKPKG